MANSKRNKEHPWKRTQRFLGVIEAAAYTGMSSESIRRLITAGKLTGLRPVTGRVLIDRVELDQWVLSARAKPVRGRGWSSKSRARTDAVDLHPPDQQNGTKEGTNDE